MMPPRGEDAEIDDGEAGPAPGSPSEPEIVDWDATTVKLKWKAPSGDAPITFYIMEYKAKSESEWQQGPKVKPSKTLNGTVDALTTGVKYEFRVVAENRNGRSDPSEITLPILVKSQKEAAQIDRKAMEDRAVKVNQQLDLSVPVKGEPAPECSWQFNGNDIVSSDNVKVSSGGNSAKLLLIPSKRCHVGKYTLKAKNKWGEDSCDVNVQVYGKPTIPNGPIEVSEVTKRTCHLKWKASDDDGGNPIIQYEVEKMDEATGTWLPAGNTKGTSFDVRNLVEGKSYKFLVRAVNKDGDSPDLETDDFTLAKNAFDVPSQPGKVKATNWGTNWAELAWKAPEDDGGAEITSYKIEMRDVDKRSWNEILQTKDTTCTVDKCGIEIEHEYVFRVTAINAGGESEVSETSASIEAMERFVKPKLNKDILGAEKELCASQLLKIEAVVTAEPAAKVSWFFESGDELIHNGDSIIIDSETKNRSVVTVKNIERKHKGNLKIIAKNSEGEDEHQIRLNILAPPSKPTGQLEVSNVKPTSCHLSWQKPSDDGGSPLTGYTIERKDVEKDYWSVCGKISGKMATVMKLVDFDINDLVENFCYVFRVMACNAIGESEPLMSFAPTVAKFELDPPNQPYNINIIDYDKKWVKLDWCVAPGPKATKFVVEKTETFMIPKDDEEEIEEHGETGEDEEKPAFVMPVVREVGQKREQEYVEYSTGWMLAESTEDDINEIKITDLQEGYRYQFRVKAVNKAGSSYPSEPTDEIVAKQRKQKPTIERSHLPNDICLPRGDNMTLKVKVKGEPNPERAWFWGKREIKPSGSVLIEDSENTSKLTILSLERADTGVITFRAENMHGEAEASVEVVVTVPPNKPKGPMHIDDIFAEGCTASWSAPEDDGGSPITHYIVEKVQGNGESFSPCGRVTAPTTTCSIKGLTENKEYRLQVKAVNAMGESEPLLCVDGFITECPFQVPGAPGVPELYDWDSDHFDMKWSQPRNDGGSKITGYELEARLWKEMSWFKAGEVKMQYERGIVEGVELGHGYAVRVRARNVAGFGPWSLETEQVVCKHKALKPKIKLDCPKELTIKEGETFTMFANIEGEPAPENAKWLISDRELVSSPESGILIDNAKSHVSKLQIDAISRKDSGILICEAANMHGNARGTCTLSVIGKPSMPEDRLLVSNIDSSGCKLSWKACKDSGGIPVEYLVEKFAVHEDAWMKQGITSNTDYSICDLDTGREYAFRVFAQNAVGESDPLTTSKTIFAKNQYTVSLPPSAPEVVSGNERSMAIRWNAPIDDGGAPITGYHVEARTQGTTEWQPWELLDNPATSATMQKLQRGLEYQFRVIAVNKAGKSEPSHPSRFRLAKESDLLPFIEVKGVRDVTANARDRVKFDVPIFGEPAPSVIWRRIGADGEGDDVESLGDKSIAVTTTDTHTKIVFGSVSKAHEAGYTLTITNRSGSDSAKFSLKVLAAPAAPEPPMKATVSQEGSECTLLWKKVKDDGGVPIDHYQVEKMDNEKEFWCACGHTKDNTITIKGLQAGRQYTFRVCAVNKIGDSDFLTSEPVALDDATTRSL